MKEIIFDIEANSLDPDIIHCIVAKPLGEPMVCFKPHQIEEGIKSLDNTGSKKEGKKEEDPDTVMSGIMIEEKTIFNELVEEIRKTLRYYMKINNNSFFNTFYLLGGSSLLPGLDQFIADHLNVKFELLDPFKKIKNSKKLKNPNEFSVALGLALRGLEK